LAEQPTPIMMDCDQGFYIKDVGHYTEEGTPYADPIELVSDGGDFNPFSMLSAGQRLYAKAGSTLGFMWSEKPTSETAATVTLVAKKRVESESDTAIVKLSGWFQIHDSINGWVRDSMLGGDPDSLRVVLNLNQFAFFSDDYKFEDTFLSNFFYDDFSATASGFDPVRYQHGTATIKNMSNVARQLTLVPYNSGLGFISSIDENPN